MIGKINLKYLKEGQIQNLGRFNGTIYEPSRIIKTQNIEKELIY